MNYTIRVLGGAAIGGLLGYFAFVWLLGQGFYALILPGALLGVGASLARNRSVALAVVCGLLALGLGVFAEWKTAPFKQDKSLVFFLTHLHENPPLTLIMLALGGLMGFYLPFSKVTPGQRSMAGRDSSTIGPTRTAEEK